MEGENEENQLNIKIPIALSLTINKETLGIEQLDNVRYLFPGFPDIEFSLFLYENELDEPITWELDLMCSPSMFTFDYKIEAEIQLSINNSNIDISSMEYICSKTLKLYDDIKKRYYQKWNEDIEGRDFTIVVDNQELRVHKEILRYNSLAFAAMLESKWKETAENRLEIPLFSYKTVETAIQLCYGEEYKKPFKIQQNISLFKFADKYNFEKLKVRSFYQGWEMRQRNIVGRISHPNFLPHFL